ncbi:ADP-ribosylation factor 1-like [Brachionus plicatilis]|uniref:ADP-ribosylation factor 1-like n=1 Tax=Brachionus plicatilis TaxID=10195 RepID=A0A3M7R3J2_BRAPC|nr:ADP-ribosylation factor 1-like [Brachionus plicatilis]
MGNFKSFLFNKPEPIRGLFLGLDAAGKTTILYCLKLGEIVTTMPTIGFNVETLEHKGFGLTAWDVGGRDKLRVLYRHYFEKTKIIIFVIDSSDTDRLMEAKEELHKICAEGQLQNCMLLVLANKQDLEKSMPVDEIRKEIEFDSIVLQPKQIFGTVATKRDNLEVVLDWIRDNYEENNNRLIQPVAETYNDIKDVTKAESWIEYFKKITQKIFIGTN